MVIFITFCIVIIIQTLFYLFLFGKFSFAKSINRKYKSFPLSVVICAKNEENNLKKNLPKIATQNYNSFEIILVNDASTDGSLKVMQDFKTKFSSERLSIKIIDLENRTGTGKKNALRFGIDATKNEYLILTDADCQPNSSNWINEICSNFSNTKVSIGLWCLSKS